MVLTPRLDLRQSQALVMTPQLQQAIKLLQFSSLELAAYVEQELEQNPLLERDETFDRFDAGELEQKDLETLASDSQGQGDPRSVDLTIGDGAPLDLETALDVDYTDNIFDAGGADNVGDTNYHLDGFRQSQSGTFDEHQTNLEETLSNKPTLQDHLAEQLAIDIDDPVDRLIGVCLIDMVDESGYLTGDLSQVADFLGCGVERVEATLVRLQKFDPPGIFARNLAECLTLQLQERGLLDQAMRTLLANLDLLAKRDWAALAKVCDVGSDAIAKMVAEIRSLNPKPALVFDCAVAQPITPDVIMRPQPRGGWIVELNSETLPRVLVNNRYFAQIRLATRSKGDKHYINECLQSANWLVKALHQRATTILKVAVEIVLQQQGFFVNGVHHLKPLILRDVADAISMHESTVSRVTSNKFIATPRGIFELKYFFTHGVGGTRGGDVHSAASVRHRLKVLIDAETADGVLSDDALADALQKQGIDIARRTVAKYREAMGISSSVQRRREKGERL